MSKAVSSMLQNPWVALIGGFLLAVGARQTAPGTTWGQLLQPEQVLPMLGILGGLFLTMNARRPGEPPESPVDRAVRHLKETTAARERRRPPTPLLVAMLTLSAFALSACASTTPGRLVQAIEIGADLHRETMVAAGAASVPVLAADGAVLRPPVITAEQLERIRVVGRRAELTLRGARAAVDLYLAARVIQGGGDQPAAEASAAVAAAQAAILDLVRVAAELGLEVRHAGG